MLVEQDGAEVTYRPQPALRLSSILMMHAAVKAGAGATILPLALVARDLDSGALASWGPVLTWPIEVWILHATQRLASPKVTGFVSFVADQFATGRLELGHD